MADEIDAMLQGSDQGTDLASQAEENKSLGSNIGTTSEEDEFSGAPESWKRRFDSLTRKLQQKDRELEEIRQRSFNPPPPVNYDPNTHEAVKKLGDVGITTDEKAHKMISEAISQLRFQSDLDRLEERFNGNDGKPRFSREEYKLYVEDHPQFRDYNPMDVYEKMYKEELLDWELNHRGQKPKTSSMRPTKVGSTVEEGDSAESVEQKLSSLMKTDPAAAIRYYEDHLDQIKELKSR